MSPQVHVTVILNFKPELADEFFNVTLPELLRQTIQRPGVISVRGLRDEVDPNRILFLDIFADRKSVDDYFKWRTDSGDLDNLAKSLQSAPEISIWGSETVPS